MKRALLLVLLCACGKARSLIPVDVYPPAGASGLEHLELVVSQGSAEVVRQQYGWTATGGEPLKVGIYVPSSVEGRVTVVGTAADGRGAAGSDTQMADVSPGKKSALVTLHLVPGTSMGDGGANDGGVDGPSSPAPDGAAPDSPGNADRGPDVRPPDGGGGVEAGPPDVPPTARSWRATENIENDLLASSYLPHVAIDPNAGHVLVSWVEQGRVKVRRYDATLGAWGMIKTLEDRGAPDDSAIGVGASGQAIVVWPQEQNNVTPDLQGIWAAHSKDGGVTWDQPVRIHNGPMAYTFSLAVARNGAARLAWQESANNINTLWSASYTNGMWINPAAVRPSTDVNEREPVVAIDATGAGLLVWTQPDAMGNDSAWGASFAAAGTVGTPQLLEAFTTDWAREVTVAVAPDGHGAAVWDQPSSASTTELWINEYASGAWKGPQRVFSVTDAAYPALTVDRASAMTLVWAQPLASGRWNLVAARSVPGTGWGAPGPLESLNQAPGLLNEIPRAKLGVDSAGTVHVVWHRKPVAMATAFTAHTRRFSGGAWQPEELLGDKARLRAYDPEVAVAEDGRAAAVFYYTDPAGTLDPDAFNVFAALFR